MICFILVKMFNRVSCFRVVLGSFDFGLKTSGQSAFTLMHFLVVASAQTISTKRFLRSVYTSDFYVRFCIAFSLVKRYALPPEIRRSPALSTDAFSLSNAS